MELQFDKYHCKSLHKNFSQILDQELTMDIRLPESLPDVGRVLGSWGQVILRGKEWRSNSVGISGGVMAWVLYTPDNGTHLESVETWIPFQMHWDIPESQRDGTICTLPLIKAIDARSISARKLMLRVNISVNCSAYEPRETPIYRQVEQLPEDIQVLKQTYPLELPVEAGEKQIQLEERLILEDFCPPIDKICYFDITPQITETKILGNKLLFRGNAKFHVAYSGSNNQIQILDQELLFSQYTLLDTEYGLHAKAWLQPVITGLELELTAEQPMIKAAISIQYIIYDQKMLELTEDAYSITRELTLDKQSLQIYSRLDATEINMELSQKLSLQAKQILDAVWYPEHPEKSYNSGKLEITQPGILQLLYIDAEDNYQCGISFVKQTDGMVSAPQNQIDLYSTCMYRPQVYLNNNDVSITIDVTLQSIASSENGLEMVTGMKVGNVIELDPLRPSLILQKTGKKRIWDIAKQHSAKISDIQSANNIQDEPSTDQVILIPIT